MTTPKYRIVIEKNDKHPETDSVSGSENMWTAGGSSSGDEDGTGDYNIPEFLRILWKLVNDRETNSVINWTNDGKSFLIDPNSPLWKNLLAVHYKHSNIMSFIRQLNLYGFKKVSLKRESFSTNTSGLMCFNNANFRKNHPQLLKKIKRQIRQKQANCSSASTSATETLGLNSEILKKIESLSSENTSIFELLNKMKKENMALWRELALLRQSHQKQQDLMQGMFHFLFSFMGMNNADKGGFAANRKRHLMIEDRQELFQKAKQTKKTSDTNNITDDENDSDRYYTVTSASETSPQPQQPSAESAANTTNSYENVHDAGCTASPINNDVILTPVKDRNDIEREINEWLSRKAVEPLNVNNQKNNSSSQTTDNCLDSEKILSLITASTKHGEASGSSTKANTTATANAAPPLFLDTEYDSLHELINQKKCNIDTNSILDMFNYTNALPVDYDFLSLINENDLFPNTNEQQLIPYSGSSSSLTTGNFLDDDDLDKLLDGYRVTPSVAAAAAAESSPKSPPSKTTATASHDGGKTTATDQQRSETT